MTPGAFVPIFAAPGIVWPGGAARMRRIVTMDPAWVRRWAEERRARPVLHADGRVSLALPDTRWDGASLSWDEFAGMFTAERLVFVCDDEPGSDGFELGVRPAAASGAGARPVAT